MKNNLICQRARLTYSALHPRCLHFCGLLIDYITFWLIFITIVLFASNIQEEKEKMQISHSHYGS